MHKISDFIVNHCYAIFGVFLVFVAICAVLSTRVNINNNAGKEVKIYTKLKITPLLSTSPISRPIVKLIAISTIKPTTVVTELDEIAPNE